jgi:nicotinamidase-related amidase
MNIDKNAALLIIDMQQGINDARFGARNNGQAEDNISRLLFRWRQETRPIVHIRHLSRSPHSVFWPGQAGVEFQTRFLPENGEHVIEKNVPDAFVATALEQWLKERAIGQVVITGVITNNSVESTARSSGNLGFNTIVVSDATYTFEQKDLNGRIWSAEDIHILSLSNLAADYASINTTEHVLGLLT